jgi:hypothetical protein
LSFGLTYFQADLALGPKTLFCRAQTEPQISLKDQDLDQLGL